MSAPFANVEDYAGPPPGTCDVWWARADAVRPWHQELFDAVETERASRYLHDEDRARFVVGVALTRLLVGDIYDVEPVTVSLDRTCAECGKSHGRPVIVSAAGHDRSAARADEDKTSQASTYELSIAHSGAWVLVALTQGCGVGVDIEQVVEREDNRDIARRLFTESEQREIAAYSSWTEGFYRQWVAKESALKAVGEGLSTALDAVSVPPLEQTVGRVEFRHRIDVNATLQRLEAPPGYAAAVTTLTPQNVPLRMLRADERLSAKQRPV